MTIVFSIIPDLRVSGRWYGSCRDGLASERGYGVILDGSGIHLNTWELQDGMPSGTGGMIASYSNQTGAFYFEGDSEMACPMAWSRLKSRVGVRGSGNSGPEKMSEVAAEKLQRLKF